MKDLVTIVEGIRVDGLKVRVAIAHDYGDHEVLIRGKSELEKINSTVVDHIKYGDIVPLR